LRAGEPVFGERLTSVVPGPLAVPGAEIVLVGLGDGGDAVHVVALTALRKKDLAVLGREIDRVIALEPPADGRDDRSGRDVAIDEWRFVEVSTEKAAAGPRRNRLVLVVEEEPDVSGWRRLIVEVGPRLAGLYLDRSGDLTAVALPPQLRRPQITHPNA
jgi:hypothetical protein